MSDSAESTTGITAAPQGGRSVLVRALMAVCVVLALAAAAGGGYLYAIGGVPDSDSADAGFARSMQAHHAQAVDMSMTILKKTDDPTLSSIAYDIVTTQQQQAGQLYGWLELWNLPQAGNEPMAWMYETESMGAGEHDMSTMPTTIATSMPGRASEEELRRLHAANGREAETLYLQLMIRHHQGGISMARAVRRLGDQPQVRSIAEKMIDSQTAEITQMQHLLKQRKP